MSFEQGSELVHLGKIHRCVRADSRSLVGRRLDETLGLKYQQRLPGRRPADSELTGKPLLFQPTPGRMASVEYRLPDCVSCS